MKRMKIQMDELTRSKDELTQLRNRLSQENTDLQRQVHEYEVQLDAFTKNKSQAQQKLESTQTKLEEEIRVRDLRVCRPTYCVYSCSAARFLYTASVRRAFPCCFQVRSSLTRVCV